MAIIHFIWWGPPRGDDSIKTPSDVALACRGTPHSVKFWCREEHVEEFSTLLVGSSLPLTVESCSNIREILGQTLHATNPRLFDEAQEILTYLDTARAFSAIKDLISLFVLYRHGGYYLDTTTFIDSERKGSVIKALGQTYTAPRLVQLTNGAQIRHVPWLQTGRSIAFGDETRVEIDAVFVPLIDVWAMYSPETDPTILLVIESYVSRSNRMGLVPHGEPSNFDNIKGADILKNPESGRDELIGNLIIRATYDGFIVGCCQGNADLLPQFCWRSPETETLERILPALGIRKIYKNSWRNLVLA